MVNYLSPVKMDLLNDLETTFSIQSPNINQSISELDNFLSSSTQEGRESLGILSLDFREDVQNSSNFLNVTVFDLESLNSQFDFQSLNPHSDLGRESLGILHIDQLNVNLEIQDDNSPGISLLSPVPTNLNFTRNLDTAFLMTPTKYSNSSFNSNSLELPSKIFVLTKSDNSVASSAGQSFLNNAQIMTTSNEENRLRCMSQPLSNDLKVRNQKEFFWSTGRPIKTNFLPTSIYGNKLKFDDKEDIFYDSVFIEGNHLAQKIADGSFLNDDAPANGILDCTPQPDWPDFDESEVDKEKSPRLNSETVIKAIDKMFPTTSQIDDFKIKTTRSESASSKSRDAKDILDNLSEIFNNTHRSEKQKSEGRMLLNNLVELLNNSQYICDTEDSGHSSNPENESVAVHSNKILSCDKVANVSDMSERDVSSESGPKKRLSQTFCSIKSVQQKAERRSSLKSGSSLNNNKTTNNADVKSKQNSAAPLKLKPVKVTSKKGPLIAIIPVEDMKKTNSCPNTTNKRPIARTSTPINEPKLKPPFTSTPRNNSSKAPACKPKPKLTRDNSFDSNNSNDGSKKPDTFKVSKLRKTSLTKEPLHSRTQTQPKPVRRNTISEGMAENLLGRKRSNSLGKETGIMSVLPMIRQNLLQSSYYNKKSPILSNRNAKVESNEEKQVNFKVADKSVKLKKNKENLRP